jgi:isoleucyl-tRNA synthetase
VHLSNYPEVSEAERFEDLERQVALVREIVNLGMAVRERERIAVRRPLPRLTVISHDPVARAAVEAFRADVMGELNVKEIDISADDSGVVALEVKANFKSLGRRLGKKMKSVALGVSALDAKAIARLMAGEFVEVEGERLEGDDVLITRSPLPGLAAESGELATVVLDTTIDEGLRLEGWAREIVNRIQSLRKKALLEVSDRIHVEIACDPPLAAAVDDSFLRALMAGETLADDLRLVDEVAPSEDSGRISSIESIDDHAIHITLRPSPTR